MKHQVIIIGFLLFAVTEMFAQSSVDLQLYLNPTVSYRKLFGITQEYWTDERPIFNYDAGVVVTLIRRSKLSLSTGIVYSRKGYSWGNYPLVDGNPKMVEIFSFAEIPVRLTIPVWRDRAYLLAGVSNDILIRRNFKVLEYSDDEKVGNLRDPTKYNIGIILGGGFNIKGSQEINLSIEPNLKFQIRTHAEAFERNLYTIGLAATASINGIIKKITIKKKN